MFARCARSKLPGLVKENPNHKDMLSLVPQVRAPFRPPDAQILENLGTGGCEEIVYPANNAIGKLARS